MQEDLWGLRQIALPLAVDFVFFRVGLQHQQGAQPLFVGLKRAGWNVGAGPDHHRHRRKGVLQTNSCAADTVLVVDLGYQISQIMAA